MAVVYKIEQKPQLPGKPKETSRGKRKVAIYARVSTDHEEQQTSLKAQMDYYRKMIAEHEDWVYAATYADDGISGTSIKRRKQFLKMMEACEAGEIDLILTKSISRFARNTVDSVKTLRKLKELNVEVFFQKENIWTRRSEGEFLITLMSSLAQEESRSISENTAWGQRRRFAAGNASVAYKQFLGYDKGPDGKWVVNEEQAKTVRTIYRRFLEGYSYAAIAKQLTEEGVLTPSGKKKWQPAVVKSILCNEKYKGDALLQKSFTVDFLTKKTKTNEGEIPQFYVKEHHPAIIDPETFDLVQEEVGRRSRTGKRYSAVSVFSSKIVCGDCGGFYGSKVWHSNDRYRRKVWRCNQKYKEHGHAGNRCSTPTVTEEEIKAAFIKAMNGYLDAKDEIIRNIENARKILCSIADLEKEKDRQAEEMNVVSELMHRALEENATVAQDQEEYEKKYAELEARYNVAEKGFHEAEERIEKQRARNRLLCQMTRQLKDLAGPLAEFDAGLWGVFVEQVTVLADRSMVVRFKDGTEIPVQPDKVGGNAS